MSIRWNNRRLARRSFLHGTAGATIALPIMEAMLPALRCYGESPTPDGIPVRLAFFEFSFGVLPKEWFPTETGWNYKPAPAFASIDKHRRHYTVFGGMENPGFQGDPHFAMEAFLSCLMKENAGPTDVSVDLLAAQHLGRDVRYPNFVLGSYTTGNTGTRTCTITKGRNMVPVPGMHQPTAVFKKLFGLEGSAAELDRMFRERRSIIDESLREVAELERRIGKEDREKLDEYLTSVRRMETELQREIMWSKQPKPPAPLSAPQNDPELELESGVHIRLMSDLMIAAFQTDQTRVLSYHMPTLHVMRELGMTAQRHSSVHGSSTGSKEALEWERRYNRFLMDHFAYLIDRLKETKEANGRSLLDYCLIAAGSSSEEQGIHSIRNLPMMLIGHGGGRVKHGRYLRYPKMTIANIYLTMLQEAGVPVDKFATSTGTLTELFQA